jgi:hypothetical protein
MSGEEAISEQEKNIINKLLKTQADYDKNPTADLNPLRWKIGQNTHYDLNTGITPYDGARTDLSYSSASKWRDYLKSVKSMNPYGALMRSVGLQNKGVTFNPYLTTQESARRWLEKKGRRDPTYKRWSIETEDLDSNPNTPDDIIMLDAAGNPRIVSGYMLNDGSGRRKAAILYNQFPDRRAAAAARKQAKANKQMPLFNRWMKDQSYSAKSFSPYGDAWASRLISQYPKMNPDYYNDNANKSAWRLIQQHGYDKLRTSNKNSSTDPFFMESAQQTIKQVYRTLLNLNDQDRAAVKAYVLTYPARIGDAVLQYYNGIQPRMKTNYTIKDPVWLHQSGVEPPPFQFVEPPGMEKNI